MCSKPGLQTRSDTGATAPPVATSNTEYGSKMMPTSSTTLQRPSLIRSATTTAAYRTSTTVAEAVPILARPVTSRAASLANNASALEGVGKNITNATTKPSLFRRATDALDLDPAKSYTIRHAPPLPTYWTDHAHEKRLLATWDVVRAEAAAARLSVSGQLLHVERAMRLDCAELAEGSRPLSREWIEYVLGVNLRPPFCSWPGMGRFELLAASGGARANWGPW
ncbi:hypothetical protein BAUCODRAFT_28033 [Baudoinia panamericana UAMH 10762]|uniref:Uncharacterized protein n=1 Tax=Baudoinia panamericana (strain UAMH 10762) TaxID=717646 RepID=M2MZL2_BAUPA|nr:uncharacterized protein BAUCODRAFT_28033 [Baudoinia panamericana UAMH 10762]EMC91780.1 hypothetical protein BAUCODRAFT_28033 [Baudoinia panamericana UAMH 10762]